MEKIPQQQEIANLLAEVPEYSQEVFNQVIDNYHYVSLGEFDTPQTIEYVVQFLKAKKENKENITFQILASPGAGKTKLAQEVKKRLDNCVVLATDDYNIDNRNEREKFFLWEEQHLM